MRTRFINLHKSSLQHLVSTEPSTVNQYVNNQSVISCVTCIHNQYILDAWRTDFHINTLQIPKGQIYARKSLAALSVSSLVLQTSPLPHGEVGWLARLWVLIAKRCSVSRPSAIQVVLPCALQPGETKLNNSLPKKLLTNNSCIILQTSVLHDDRMVLLYHLHGY